MLSKSQKSSTTHKLNKKVFNNHQRRSSSKSKDQTSSKPATIVQPDTVDLDQTQTFADICTHLYQKGFLNGLLSDITLRAFDQSFRLHRILLVRSPYFERMLLANESTFVLDLQINDVNVTQEAFSLCLAYLYGAPVVSHIKQTNALAILACAYMLGLSQLASHCADILVEEMSMDSLNNVITIANDDTLKYGRFSEAISNACIRYLAETLPNELKAFSDAQGQISLIRIYSTLPFPVLKSVLEDELEFPQELRKSGEFAKFQFAKKVLECRKNRNESVVLLFDSNGGKVVISSNKTV